MIFEKLKLMRDNNRITQEEYENIINALVEEAETDKDKKESIFKEYDSKERDVAPKIFAELYKRFVTVKIAGKTRRGFYLDDVTKQIGLLSQCHCLQTMVSLAEDFKLKFDNREIIEGQEYTIREIMDIIVEDILKDICRESQIDENKGDNRFDNVTEFVFDAAPYNSSCYSVEYSDINSITWVVTSFLLILKHHATIGEVCKWEKALVNVIRYGIRYILDAYIEEKNDEKSDDDKNKGQLEIGWNFTKNCKEPSLYFSYTVCECYLDIYETFSPFLSYLHEVRNSEEYYSTVKQEHTDEFNKKKAEYEAGRNKIVDESSLKARYDEYNELARVYRLINDIDDHDELTIKNTIYGQLEEKCKNVAARVWELTKKDMAEKFFYNNLRDTVTEQEIRMSTTSDVLFNTVYIINILLCAGLDETLELEQIRYTHNREKDKASKKQQEYNNLLESCLLAEQKAFRVYESLKEDGKEYIVDQFLVGFNENFRGHAVPISELRKLRMRAFSLLPLLINTNNKVCEYLIKYPHYNMSKYYGYIMDNRLVSRSKVCWIWERDGFFSGSNYYYVLALKGFYDYYEEYEKKYIRIGKENAEREKDIKAKHMLELEAPNGEISDLKETIKTRDETIEEKQKLIEEKDDRIAKLESARPTVEGTVRKLVEDVVAEMFAPLFADTLEQASRVLTPDLADNTADDDNSTYKKIYNSLFELSVISMIKRCCDPVTDADGKCAYLANSAAYDKLKKRLSEDFAKTMVQYVLNVDSLADNDANSRLLNLFK